MWRRGEQSSQMPAGLCNHSMKEFQPLRKRHKPERARSASFDTSRIVYDDPELLHICIELCGLIDAVFICFDKNCYVIFHKDHLKLNKSIILYVLLDDKQILS
jgi:hypothetical protein